VQSGTEDEQRDAALYRCVGLLKDSRLAAIRFYQLSVELFPLDRYTTLNLFDLQVVFEILSTVPVPVPVTGTLPLFTGLIFSEAT
jgi:hypothetical protein